MSTAPIVKTFEPTPFRLLSADEIMTKSLGFTDRTPCLSFIALAILCFVTLLMSQTRFKISKEVSREIYPPILRSKDCWFLYTIGNPDRFKCVLRAFVVISSPILSLVSTCLLLLGKIESNPYFFIPWLFLTLKGLLFVQTDNLITILSDMATRTNYAFGFRVEDFKWLLFYFTIFLVDLLEAFSLYEMFDLFLVLWNHHPGYDLDAVKLGLVKRDIAEIMETLSKCSLGSLSKMSLLSLSDSEDTEMDEGKNSVKFSSKEDKKLFDVMSPVVCLSKGEPIEATELDEKLLMKNFETDLVNLNCVNFLNGSDEMPTSDSSLNESPKKTKKFSQEKRVISSKENVRTANVTEKSKIH